MNRHYIQKTILFICLFISFSNSYCDIIDELAKKYKDLPDKPKSVEFIPPIYDDNRKLLGYGRSGVIQEKSIKKKDQQTNNKKQNNNLDNIANNCKNLKILPIYHDKCPMPCSFGYRKFYYFIFIIINPYSFLFFHFSDKMLMFLLICSILFFFYVIVKILLKKIDIKNNLNQIIPIIASIFFLSLAVFEIEIIEEMAFYSLLKIIVSATLFYICFIIKNSKSILFWLALSLAIVFNPIVQIHLNDSNLWQIIDVFTILYLIVYIIELQKRK